MPWRNAVNAEILSVYISNIDGSLWICCSKCDVAEKISEDSGRKVIAVCDHSVTAHVATDLIGIGHSQDTVADETATATVVAPVSKVATAIGVNDDAHTISTEEEAIPPTSHEQGT